MEKFVLKQEKSMMEVLADELWALQAEKNDGRGVSCVREVIAQLRAGDIESAWAVYQTDADKISNYPDIQEILESRLRPMLISK